ncbi:MAG: hypothetical protein E7604_12840 [Ruminococcaceae bacterium]|nr:hypothetical protein [Oscillospiraceae bacterium]
MKPFITEENGIYTVHAAKYTLTVDGHKLGVLAANNPFAALDIRCAVPMTNETNDGEIPDAEPRIPTLVSVDTTPGNAVFVWENESSLWKKTYTLRCTYLHFTFHMTLHGHGRVDAVRYFAGDFSDGKQTGSDYEFSEGFTPCISWYDHEDYTFKASVDCHRWSVLMVPPMFCYAFRCEGIGTRLGLGLAAKRGEHNFHCFDYNVTLNTGRSSFWLETDQAGHVTVDGDWEAPHIIGFTGEDQWDILNQYSEYYFVSGIAKSKKTAIPPRFWHGPFLCGWIEQNILGMEQHTAACDLSTEAVYEEMIANSRRFGLNPRAVILDDKWQIHYATDVADPEKFPDLRAFVNRHRAEGLHTLLWFKLWDPEGWDPALCVTADNGEICIDPSQPAFQDLLREVIHRLLSSDEGCYDCDGFKLDYAFCNPIGRGVKSYSGKYGVELLYDMMVDIYNAAKAVKPEALVNCSPCHPYFAHICDQARLHDYEPKNRNCRTDLTMRARLFSAAMPGVLLDTDNAGYNTRRDTMEWMLAQTQVGVPDLYAARSGRGCPLDDADFAAIAQVWDAYNARIDAMYGEYE